MRITKTAFKAWLAQNKRKYFYMSVPCACPIARYLSEKSGTQVHVTSPDAYSDDWEMTLPEWATTFVDNFDALPGYRTRGERALRLL